MIYTISELGKTKPVNSKTRFLMLSSKMFGLTSPHNKYWISLFKAGSNGKGVGRRVVRGVARMTF